MFQPVKIAPSILSADFMNLQRDIETIERGGAGYVHVDVMDGHFVPNLTIGVPHVKQLKGITNLPLDVHLMIENPLEQIPWFLAAGADMLTVHWEACTHLHRTIYQIKEEGMLAGVALNPHTPVSGLEDVINDIDLVLIMSVNPGFGGQKFIPRALHKIAELREMVERNNSEALIEVDGGVCQDNIADIMAAGADAVVAGSAVFKAEDPKIAIQNLKNI